MELVTTQNEPFEVHTCGMKSNDKALLILHDWWGVLEYNLEWAENFATEGYHVAVPDLFDGYHPADTKTAGEYTRSLEQACITRKLVRALDFLHEGKNRKVAILGWSFGGLQAQHAILNEPDKVNALLLFYCRIIFKADNIKQVNCPLLAFFSESERTWPDKQQDLEQTAGLHDIYLETYSYEADHGFANPNSPRYDADVSAETKTLAIEFLHRHL